MTALEAQIRMIWAWSQTRVDAVRGEDPERGDGILIWVIMTAILAAAAIAVVAIIVTKAKDSANNVKTQ